jgi:hypothetical protein
MALRRVPIENLESSSSGVAPAELPPAGPDLAPLLPSDPLFGAAGAGEGSTPPPEGQRVRTEIGQRYGVDLANVPLDRSPAGASEANRLQARGFTSDRGIVIPSDVGSLESGPGEALLAHELTHAAQRARFGPTLPDESTPAGRSLEADALSTELTLRTGLPARSAPLEPPSEVRRPSWAERLSGTSAGSETGQPFPLVAPTSSGPDPDVLAASILERMSALSTPPPAPGISEVFTAPSLPMAPAAPSPMTGGGMQRADEAPAPAASGAPAPSSATPEHGGHGSMSRPSNEDLTNLSRWLYPLIKYQLKGELREDRERAGLLTDHYRRW